MTIRTFALTTCFNILWIIMSCSSGKKVTATTPASFPVTAPVQTIPMPEKKEDEFMLQLFKTQPQWFDSILIKRNELNVQVIYTQVNRDANGNPSFTRHYFNKNGSRYFYPASTVKFPVVLLALQKLKELNIPGLDKNSTMITDAAFSGQQATFNDPNTRDGRPTIAQYIKQVLLVSDNNAFNRLYEFVGQEYINKELNKRGYDQTEILHRLDVFLTETENRTTNPILFYDSSNKLVYAQPMQVNRQPYAKRNDLLGEGYYSGGKLIHAPMDFSKKNRMPLTEFNEMLMSVIFPQTIKEGKRFNITEEDRRFVMQYMSEYPGESVYPFYDKSAYPDAYVKMILFGTERGIPPPSIRIFNKTGTAYGQLTEAAYIVDYDKGVEFFVAATIDCNTDRIYNDDKYAYDSLGYPFLKNLGRLLYNHELKRIKKISPDLSGMKFTYN